MVTKEECETNRLRIQQVISLLRNNPAAVEMTDCNLLENGANSLLNAIREARGWSTAELPNIRTLGEWHDHWRRNPYNYRKKGQPARV